MRAILDQLVVKYLGIRRRKSIAVGVKYPTLFRLVLIREVNVFARLIFNLP